MCWGGGSGGRRRCGAEGGGWRRAGGGGEDGVLGSWGGGDEIDDAGHFIEFFRADVGAVGESEVDLTMKTSCQHIHLQFVISVIAIHRAVFKENPTEPDSRTLCY